MIRLLTLLALLSTPVLAQVSDAERQRIEADSGAVLEHPVYGTILRTPSERFANLPDYPFAPHYVDVDPGDDFPLYVHYLDEGPRAGEIILLLHGNPAWSYLVRDLVGPLTAAGYRVIAPDLVGFGKSDKPADRAVQTYGNQTEWVTNFITELDLDSITLHCQDWGGLIGLRVAVYQEDRFARVVASNTALPDGTIGDEESFGRWRDVISQNVENFSTVMDRATVSQLTPADLIAYDAPFPDNRYTAGPRQLPAEVPFDPASPAARENKAALDRWAEWEKPLMTLFSEPTAGGVTAGGQEQLRDSAPGAAGYPHLNFSTDLAGHYIREDIPDTISRYLIEFMRGEPFSGGDSTVITDSLIAYAATFPAMPKELLQLAQITGQRTLTFGSGLPYNDLEYTLYDTDYMEGETNGFDNFMPVDPTREFPGADQIKIIRAVNNVDLDEAYSGTQGDRIILGTAEIDRPFFLRGADGVDNDYVSISNFDYDFGYVQLHGQRSDYELVYCDEACASPGYYLFYVADERPDLIAFIFPCDDLALPISGVEPRNPRALCNSDGTLRLDNPNHFRFAEPLSTTIAESDGLAQVGGPGKELIGGLTLDGDGNVYLFGLTDRRDGQTELDNQTFVRQILPDGSLGWSTELTLPDGSLLFDAVTDSSFLYAAGRTLGALPGFSNAGRWDGILIKYRLSDGVIVATDQFGNEGLDGYGNIVLDDAGNLFVSAQGSPEGVGGTDGDYLLAKHRSADLSNVWREIVTPDMPDRVIVSEAWGGLSYRPGASPGDGTVITAGWYMSLGGANAFVERWEDLTAATPTRTAATRINSPGSEADWVLDHTVDEAGNVYVVGFTSGTLGDRDLGEHDAYIAVLDPDLSNPRFVQVGTERSDAYRKVARDAEGNLYAMGYTYGDYAGSNADAERESGDIIVDKFSAGLELLESRQFGTPHEERGYLELFDGGLYVGGTTEASLVGPSGGSFDGFVVRLDTADLRTAAIATSTFTPRITTRPLVIFPNPAGGSVTVVVESTAERNLLSVTDVSGREVARQSVVSGTIQLDVRQWPTGVYTVRVTTARGVAVGQLVVR